MFEVEESTENIPKKKDRPLFFDYDNEDEMTPTNLLFNDLNLGTRYNERRNGSESKISLWMIR